MVGGLSWGYIGPSWGHVGLSWGQCGPILGLYWPILVLFWPILGLCWPILNHKLRKMRKNAKRTKHRKIRGFWPYRVGLPRRGRPWPDYWGGSVVQCVLGLVGWVGRSWFVLLGLALVGWGYLGPAWGYVGPFWSCVGPSWTHLGAILARLEAVRAHFGAIMAQLGAMLAHLGGYLGPSSGLYGRARGLSWPILTHLRPLAPEKAAKMRRAQNTVKRGSFWRFRVSCGRGRRPSLLRRGENCHTARTRPGGPTPGKEWGWNPSCTCNEIFL